MDLRVGACNRQNVFVEREREREKESPSWTSLHSILESLSQHTRIIISTY